MVLKTARTIAKRAVTQKLLVEKPDIMESANIIMRTVITKEVSPKVRMFKGKVRMRRIPPMKPFVIEINKAAKTAFQKPST